MKLFCPRVREHTLRKLFTQMQDFPLMFQEMTLLAWKGRCHNLNFPPGDALVHTFPARYLEPWDLVSLELWQHQGFRQDHPGEVHPSQYHMLQFHPVNNTSQWCELNILTSNIFKLHEKYVYFFFSWEKWQEICTKSTLKLVSKISLFYVRAFLLRSSVTWAVGVLEKVIVLLQYYNHTCVCGSYISWATVKLEPLILRSPSMYSCISERLPAVRIRWCM